MFGACIEIVRDPRCGEDAGTLFLVGILVLGEVLDLDNLDAIDLVADDETVLREFSQARVDVQAITRKEIDADLLRLVKQSPLAIGQRPQAGEEHADPDVALTELRV